MDKIFFNLIKKNIFLLPVVTCWFPNIKAPIIKCFIGLTLRYFHYKLNDAIKQNILDAYCDNYPSKYISIKLVMFCEYKSYIEFGMKWFLDTINQILSEDGIMQRLDSMDKRLDSMDKRFDSMDKRFDSIDKKLDDMINPNLITSGRLTSEDLKHE